MNECRVFIRCVLLMMIVIWSGLSVAEGISDKVKDSLYNEGMQAAVDVIDKLSNPTNEEAYFAISLVRDYGVKSSRISYYKNEMKYKESVSYRLDYYTNNLLELNESQVSDLVSLSESVLLAKALIYMRKVLYLVSNEERVRFDDIPFDLYFIQKEELNYKTISYFFSGMVAASNKEYELVCEGFDNGSFYAFFAYEFIGDELFVDCDKDKEKIKLYSYVTPMSFEANKLMSLEKEEINVLYRYWSSKKIIPDIAEVFMLDECKNENYQENRNYKICYLMSLGAEDNCTLPFWEDFDATFKRNGELLKRDGWIYSNSYAKCRIDYIKEYIGEN